MAQPGWYPDPERTDAVRWFDGSRWTEHRQAKGGAPEPQRSGANPSMVSDSAPAAHALDAEGPGRSWGDLGALAFIGAFTGLLFGGFLFNGVGALTPVEEQPGTLNRLEIEYSSVGNETNNDSHILRGTTASGEEWQIVDEDAYEVVEAEGYPQPVTVGIGEWTGTAERVQGDTWEVDHQSTNARIGLGVVLGILVLAGLLGTWISGRQKTTGLLGAITFCVFYFGAGGWLGYIGARWMQSV